MVQDRSSRSAAVRRLVLSLVAISLTACQRPEAAEHEQAQPLPQGDQLILASAKVGLPPAVAPQDLPDPDSEGARLLQQYCVTCHGLPSPRTHSVTDWPRTIRRMWLRMDGISHLYDLAIPSPPEREVILQYLLDNALQVSGSLPPGPNREFFRTTCSQCHDLADPKQHAPEDWVAVVRRMMDHMQTMLHKTLTPDEYSRIVLYLESASKS